MRRRVALGWTLALAAVTACGTAPAPETAAPPIPEIRTEAFPAEVRPQIESRLRAARAEPDNGRASGELAMLLHAREQLEQAAAWYRRAAALQPLTLRWRYYLGVVEAERGNAQAAVESLEAALGIDVGFSPARRRYADALLSLNRLDAAAEAYESLIAGDADDASARFGLGRVRALQGRTEEAIEHLSEAVRLVPDYGAAYYELSLAYRDAGRVDDARRSLELYEQRKGAPRPDDPLMAAVEALAQGAGDAVRRGVELETRGDLGGAIREHLRALEADPSLVQAHVNLVSLYGRSGEPDKAAEHYRAALELNPGQADLHYNYGVLLYTREKYAEARAAFEKALEANPSYALAHNNLGQILEREGRVDKAAEHYRAAVKAQPQYRLARFHLGRMLLAKQRPDEAAAQFQQALEPRDEMTPQVLFALAAARAQAGDRAAALLRGEEAHALAQQMGQDELARRIEQDLARLR